MSYRPGDTIHLSFTTQSAAGAATDADATPTASMRRNGAIDGAVTIAMTHNGTGDYTASATLPLTYVAGDDLELLVLATVGGVAGKGVLPLGKLDRDAQELARELLGASGTVWHVSASGSDTSDGRSWATAFATPGHAISVSTAGDAILTGPGTFSLGLARLILPAGSNDHHFDARQWPDPASGGQLHRAGFDRARRRYARRRGLPDAHRRRSGCSRRRPPSRSYPQ